MAGLTSLPYAGIYHMTKHAVIGLSECLYHELRAAGAQVHASVLCPELIATRIHRAERNRPEDLKGGEHSAGGAGMRDLVNRAIADGVESGIPPARIADRVIDAIRAGRFYILAEDAWRDTCNTRLDDVRAGRNPTLNPPSP
jgi:short-subunit dehydrogenase